MESIEEGCANLEFLMGQVIEMMGRRGAGKSTVCAQGSQTGWDTRNRYRGRLYRSVVVGVDVGAAGG